MIEASWRSLTHQWLFLHPLDTVATVRRLVAFYVDQHNRVLPHSAFRGQTPDDMYFGNSSTVPADLESGAAAARRVRRQANGWCGYRAYAECPPRRVVPRCASRCPSDGVLRARRTPAPGDALFSFLPSLGHRIYSLPTFDADSVIVFFGGMRAPSLPHTCWPAIVGSCDGFAHGGVGLDILHPVVIHDAEIPLQEGCGHGAGHFGLRLDHARARISCSSATAIARRSSALAWAICLSAFAWSICSLAPMFSPTFTSAMSMERIS